MDMPIEERKATWERMVEETENLEDLGYYKTWTGKEDEYLMEMDIETGLFKTPPMDIPSVEEYSEGYDFTAWKELRRVNKERHGLEWDWTTKTFKRKEFTQEQKDEAQLIVYNRIKNLTHRALNRGDDLIETDRGYEPSPAWMNKFIDQVLAFSDLGGDERAVVESLKAIPNHEGRIEQLWETLPELRAAYIKGAQANGEEADHSTIIEVFNTMLGIQDNEVSSVDKDRLRNREANDARMKSMDLVKVIKDSSPAVAMMGMGKLKKHYNWTNEDLLMAGLSPTFVDKLEKDYGPFTNLDYYADQEPTPQEPSPEVFKFLTEEDIAELMKTNPKWLDSIIGSTLGNRSLTATNVDNIDWLQLEDLQAQVQAEIAATEPEEVPEEVDPDQPIDRFEQILGKDSPLPILHELASKTKEERTAALSAARGVVDVLMNRVDLRQFTLDEYKQSVLETFNEKYGTEYEAWGKLTTSFFTGGLTRHQERWLLDMYDYVSERAIDPAGAGGGAAETEAENVEEATQGQLKGITHDPTKAAASQVLLGVSVSPEAWQELMNKPHKYTAFWQEYNGMSEAWTDFINLKSEQLLAAGATEEDITTFKASYANFDGMVELTRTGAMDVFADSNWAEFIGMQYAEAISNNPSARTDANLVTQVKRGLSHIKTWSREIPETMGGIGRFLMGLKNGAEKTGNWVLWSGILDDAGGGMLQGMALDMILDKLDQASGGDWASLDPNDAMSIINTTPQEIIDIMTAGSIIAGLEGKSGFNAAGVPNEVVDSILAMNGRIDNTWVPTQALEMVLNTTDFSATEEERQQLTVALRGGIDEFVKAAAFLLPNDEESVARREEWRTTGINANKSDAIVRDIWLAVKDTHVGQIVQKAMPDLDDYTHNTDQPGLFTLWLGSAGEPVQQYETALLYAMQIMLATPESRNQLKGAFAAAAIGSAQGRAMDLRAAFRLYDAFQDSAAGLPVPMSMSESGMLNFEIVPTSNFTRWLMPTETKDAKETTLDAWVNIPRLGTSVASEITLTSNEREALTSGIVKRNFNNLIATGEVGGLTEANVMQAYEVVRKESFEFQKENPQSQEVGLAETHLKVVRELTINPEKYDLDPETIPKHLKELGLFADRYIDEYGDLDDIGWDMDTMTNAISNEVRGIRSNPSLKMKVERMVELQAEGMMGFTEGVSEEDGILTVRIPWMTVTDADFGNIDVDAINKEQEQKGYSYWTATEHKDLIAKGLWIDLRGFHAGRPMYQYHDPGNKKGSAVYQHGKWYDFVPEGQYKLVRMKKETD